MKPRNRDEKLLAEGYEANQAEAKAAHADLAAASFKVLQQAVNVECNCRSWSECPGSTGDGFQGPCPGPPEPKFEQILDR